MGEAKRRKQLGLMPTLHPYEAEMDAEGQITLLRGPDDAGLRQTILEALKVSQPTGELWASDYRSTLLYMGKPMPSVRTVDDVRAIPVPPLRRLFGELAVGKQTVDSVGWSLPVPGGVLRLREQKHSFDGQKWESFARIRDPERLIQALRLHPAFSLEGAGLGQYRVEQWLEGRIDVEPEPPEGALEFLEEAAADWHGRTPEEWAEQHRERVDGDDLPLARRTYFELREVAPLQSPLRQTFATRGHWELYLLEDASYSLDGELWVRYDDPDAEPEEDSLLPGLADLFDMETVEVTVYADGRVEWDEDEEIPEEYAERVRSDLRASTGAGDPEGWRVWSRKMLLDTFNVFEDKPDEEVPVPQAVRIDLAKDAIADPDPLAQTYIESEVTFDGENWRDLYDEEIPQELLLAIANIRPPAPDQTE